MRRVLVTLGLLFLIAAFVGIRWFRHRDAPAPDATASQEAAADATAEGETESGTTADAGTAGEGTAQEAEPEEPESTEPLVPRPIKVAAVGWELLAPALVAGAGTKEDPESEFSHARVPTELVLKKNYREIEEALARGGGSKGGADLAILPLSTFVVSYQRLRALDPRIFFVVATSRGREGLAATPSVDLAALAASRSKKETRLVGRLGSPETFFALAILDMAGVPEKTVRLIAAGDTGAALAPMAAVSPLDRKNGAGSSRRMLATTADATALIPYVAVAPEGFLKKHEAALQAFCRVWLAGKESLLSDVPAAARTIANLKGSPDALSIIEILGSVRLHSLHDNARLLGLSGRGAVTLDELFRRGWSVWRKYGALSTPPPVAVPLGTRVVAALVRETAGGAMGAGITKPAAVDGESKRLLVHRMPAGKLDDRQLVSEIGYLAGIFERSNLRVHVHKNRSKEREVIETSIERFGLDPKRLQPTDLTLSGRPAGIEILLPQ